MSGGRWAIKCTKTKTVIVTIVQSNSKQLKVIRTHKSDIVWQVIPNVQPPCLFLASFPGPAQLSVAFSTVKWERAWYLFSREWHQDRKGGRKGLIVHGRTGPRTAKRTKVPAINLNEPFQVVRFKTYELPMVPFHKPLRSTRHLYLSFGLSGRFTL